MTKSYIKDGLIHIETDDEVLIDEVLERLEVHLTDEVSRGLYERGGEKIASYIELDNNLERYRKGER